jgi:ribosomal protein S19
VTQNMLGYKLGAFVKTRKEFSFKKKKGGSKN